MDNDFIVFAIWDNVEEKIIKIVHYYQHAASSVTQRVKHNLRRYNFDGLTQEEIDEAYSRYQILVYNMYAAKYVFKDGEWYAKD